MEFGILCNGNYFQKWQVETIRLLIENGHSCSLLIVNANEVPVQTFREKIVAYPYSKLLIRIWFRFLMKPDAKTLVDLSAVYPALPEIKCVTARKGYAEYFNNADIEVIKSKNLDFILRFGFGILKGEILDSAKYGVWSYHHDDDRKYRGVPTGFWEIWFNDPINAAILQRLTNQLDSGVILRKAYFAAINHSWEANLDNLLKSSTEWPLQVCRDIENGNTGFLEVKNSPGTAIFKLPGNFFMSHFLLKIAFNKVKFHYRDLFLTEKWNVGIIPAPIESFLKPGESSVPEPVWLQLNSKKSVYHADCFGFADEYNYHIVCEEYDYRNPKGFLTSLQIDKSTFALNTKSIALEKDYHLAYPYLFEFEGNKYCIPETSEANNVDLYRFDVANGNLVFEHTLIENLQAVDPSLFFHNGYWWLFFTDRISTNERLHIWFSVDLRGPYTAHANNPVKVDVRSSRPAGNPFSMNGKFFRPAQDCSIRSGRRICINEVVKLSPTVFEENVFSVLNPAQNSKLPDGMHTFCVTNGAVIVDGKRECFIWQAFIKKLSKKISKILKLK